MVRFGGTGRVVCPLWSAGSGRSSVHTATAEARISNINNGLLVFAGTFRTPDVIHLLNRGDGSDEAAGRALPLGIEHLQAEELAPGGHPRNRVELQLVERSPVDFSPPHQSDGRASAEVAGMRELLVAPPRCADQAELLRAFEVPVALLQGNIPQDRTILRQRSFSGLTVMVASTGLDNAVPTPQMNREVRFARRWCLRPPQCHADLQPQGLRQLRPGQPSGRRSPTHCHTRTSPARTCRP